jgi:curved DNA-binding protein CbpA
MPDRIDPYKTLQVDPEAEDEVIQAAYRRLARKYHPDVAGGDAAERMSAINAAWALIGEPDARRAFDSDEAIRVHAAERERQAWASAPAEPERPAKPGTSGAGKAGASAEPSPAKPRPPEEVSRDWTSGRSSYGGGYDASMHEPDGLGAAGTPPGRPSGSVLTFGRYAGWSLGEIARQDLEYIEWLDRAPIGRQYRDEIDGILRRAGRRQSADAEATDRRGLFRRR